MRGFCPDFFIAGAPRCGTTSLSAYLRGHPEVCFSSPKETHYFLASALETRFRQDPQRHYVERFFPHYDAGIHTSTGEGSVSYLYFPHVIERILELNPAARFIVMLRNPMQMVPSFHARMLYVLEEDAEDFSEAWHLQDARARGERIPPRCLLPSLLQYSEIGKLGKHVNELLSRVPRSQCLFILHDDLAAQTAAVYESVLDFLGLAHDGQTEFEIKLPSQGYRYRWLQRLLFKPPAALLRFIGDSDPGTQQSDRPDPPDRHHLPGRLRRQISGEFQGALRNVFRLAFPTLNRLRKKLVLYNSLDEPRAAPPCAEMRGVLRDHFRSDCELLAEVVGRDLSHWYDEPREAEPHG